MSSFSKSASSSSDEDPDLRRGPWTKEEDSLLVHYITRHGEGHWNLLAKQSGLRRTGKSCRLRWLNYLKPDVKRGNLTPQEQLLILDLHSKWGNRWSKIAKHLPGRTDNEIKNYWRTRVQKQARHLKVDSNSTAFQEVIRHLWMPRLIQKIQGSSVSSASASASMDKPFQDSAKTQPLSYGPTPLQFTRTNERIHHDLDRINNNMMMKSSFKNCIGQSQSSSESMISVSKIPETSECPEVPFHETPSNSDWDPFLKSCYNVDNMAMSYAMETFSDTTMITETSRDLNDDPTGDCYSRENNNNWMDGDDLAADSCCWWSMEELWQFRQLQER